MRLIVLSLATAVALTACTEQAPPAAPAGDPPAPAPSAATPTPPATKEPTTPAPAADECGAAERQSWIGRARADLPSAPAGAVWRIYETGQPVTMDYSASRLNIEINPANQTVVRVSCG